MRALSVTVYLQTKPATITHPIFDEEFAHEPHNKTALLLLALLMLAPFSHFSHESSMNNGSNIQGIPHNDSSCNDLGFCEVHLREKRTINEVSVSSHDKRVAETGSCHVFNLKLDEGNTACNLTPIHHSLHLQHLDDGRRETATEDSCHRFKGSLEGNCQRG